MLQTFFLSFFQNRAAAIKAAMNETAAAAETLNGLSQREAETLFVVVLIASFFGLPMLVALSSLWHYVKRQRRRLTIRRSGARELSLARRTDPRAQLQIYLYSAAFLREASDGRAAFARPAQDERCHTDCALRSFVWSRCVPLPHV